MLFELIEELAGVGIGSHGKERDALGEGSSVKQTQRLAKRDDGAAEVDRDLL